MTVLAMCGLQSRTGALTARERIKLQEDQIPSILGWLKQETGILECVILSTCNRTEIYIAAHNTEVALEAFRKLSQQFSVLNSNASNFCLLHEDVLPHLCRVAAGLDSMILGDGQILCQVKAALLMAQVHQSSGLYLTRLFQMAIQTAKRIRTETGLDQKDSGIAHAAFELAIREMPDWQQHNIAIIGGGKMAQVLLSLLKCKMPAHRHDQIIIVNRSHERLKELQAQFNFKGLCWDHLPQALLTSDIIFVATGAPHIILGKPDFEQHPNHSRQSMVIDIAVPCNVDSKVKELPHVRLFNVDHLMAGQDAEKQEENREILYNLVASLIEIACLEFETWKKSLSILPSMNRLRDKLETMRQYELAHLQTNQPGVQKLMDNMSRRLIQKILHDPTVQLKKMHGSSNKLTQSTAFLSHLFNLSV